MTSKILRVRLVAAVLSTVLLAAVAQGCERTKRIKKRRSRVQTGVELQIPYKTQAAREYNRRQSAYFPTGLAAQIFKVINSVLVRLRRPEVKPDQLLDSAGREYSHLSVHYGREPSSKFLTFLMNRAGVTDVNPAVVVGRFGQGNRTRFVRGLMEYVRTTPSDAGFTHVGLGLVFNAARAEHVCTVLFVKRSVAIKPMARRASVSVPLKFKAMFGAGFSGAELFVSYPTGDSVKADITVRALGERTEVSATIPFNRGVGVYRLELQGVRDTGPEVVSRFPLYVGRPVVQGIPPFEKGIGQPSAVLAEQRFLRLANQARKKAGLVELTVAPALTNLARSHSLAMAGTGKVTKISINPAELRARVVALGAPVVGCAEVEATGDGAAPILRDMLTSTETRERLLSRTFRYVGIGAALKRNKEGTERFFITAVLAAYAPVVPSRVIEGQAMRAMKTIRDRAFLTPYVREPRLTRFLRVWAARFLRVRAVQRRRFVRALKIALMRRVRGYKRAALNVAMDPAPHKAVASTPASLSKRFTHVAVGAVQRDSDVFGPRATGYIFVFLSTK